jgi:hypothetical protein
VGPIASCTRDEGRTSPLQIPPSRARQQNN